MLPWLASSAARTKSFNGLLAISFRAISRCRPICRDDFTQDQLSRITVGGGTCLGRGHKVESWRPDQLRQFNYGLPRAGTMAHLTLLQFRRALGDQKLLVGADVFPFLD